MDKIDIKSMTIEELTDYLTGKGEPKFRAKQIFKWIHNGVTDFDDMTDISKNLKQKLKDDAYIADVKIVHRLKSQIDETVKYLYELYDGEYIESVLMKYNHGYTVCISTQVGCRMGCSFCASGKNGLYRNLTASEMLAQLMAAQRDNDIRVSNVVMMGMGEPLDNFDNSVKFLRLVSDDNGMNIGLRHISLSTSGVVSGIDELAKLNFPVTLSISLHAPDDDIRSSMMPVNKKWNVEKLIKSCYNYQRITKRRISFEYALVENVNDSYECAVGLAELLKGIMCHVNLIPVNPIDKTVYKKPQKDRIFKFQETLNKMGINTTVRRTLGSDINASCGQLRRSVKECENFADIQ